MKFRNEIHGKMGLVTESPIKGKGLHGLRFFTGETLPELISMILASLRDAPAEYCHLPTSDA